jgi:hypothetical protein
MPPSSLQQTKQVTQQTEEEHHLKLYSISEVPYPSEENLDISIRVDSTNGTSTNATIKVCCGKPREEQHGDEHPYLLKAFTLGQPPQQVAIKFDEHNKVNCTCPCHPDEIPSVVGSLVSHAYDPSSPHDIDAYAFLDRPHRHQW